METGLIEGKCLNGSEIARLLDDQVVSRVEEGFAKQIESLLRAGGDEDILDRNIEPLLSDIAVGDELAQAEITFGVGVLQYLVASLLEDIVGRLLQAFDRKELTVGQAASKRNDRIVDGDFKDFPNEGFGDIRDAVGKSVFHVASVRHGWADVCAHP